MTLVIMTMNVIQSEFGNWHSQAAWMEMSEPTQLLGLRVLVVSHASDDVMNAWARG